MKKYAMFGVVFLTLAHAVFAQTLPRLAVVEFSVNTSNQKTRQDAVTVRNLVESQMISTREYRIITRDEIDKLLVNQRIAVSSISSPENVRKLQLQNISYIVTGSVDAMGNDYAVTVKILDVSTGEFYHSVNNFMGGSSRELYSGVNALVSAFVSGMTVSGEQVVQGAAPLPPVQEVRPEDFPNVFMQLYGKEEPTQIGSFYYRVVRSAYNGDILAIPDDGDMFSYYTLQRSSEEYGSNWVSLYRRKM
jgi:hypothetical protein